MATNQIDMREKRKLLDYSTNQFVLLIFGMLYLQNLTKVIYSYGLNANSMAIGPLLRDFFVWNFVPLLLFMVMLSKYVNMRLPNPLSRTQFLVGGTVGLSVIVILVVCLHGAFNYFGFLGYTTTFGAIIIYGAVSLYLMHVLQGESMIKAFTVIVLGLLVISELWELPLDFARRGDLNVALFSTYWVGRLMPVFFWFFLFGWVYREFLWKKWHLAVIMLCVITVLTWQAIVWNPASGMPTQVNRFLASVLRLSYALLLIFLPFHFAKQE